MKEHIEEVFLISGFDQIIPSTEEVFRISGFAQIIPIKTSRGDAVRAV